MENYERDTKLKEYFEFYIKQMSVDEIYHPLLVDILMRRTYEYNLQSDDIQQDVTSLVNNLDEIIVGEMPEGYESAAGLYMGADKKILLDEGFVERYKKAGDYQTLYEVLTHEVYHALSRDEYGFDRLASQNSLTGYYNSTLLEAIVEKSADRTVFSRNSKDRNAPYYHQNYFGYSDITFITDALEASYGVTEKFFLKNAILGRNRLAKVLDIISKQPPGTASEFLDGIEVNFALLHKNFYSKDENKNPIKPDEDEVKNSLESIYRLCEWKMQSRMEDFNIPTIEQAEMVAEFLKYNHNKLFIVMKNAAEGFNQAVGKDFSKKFLEDTHDQRIETLSRISNFTQILENKNKIKSEEELLEFINLAKAGNLRDKDIEKLESLGITLSDPKEIFKVSSEFLKYRQEEDFSRTKWDVGKIEKITKKAFPKKRFSEKIQDTINNVRGKLNSIFGPKKQLLNPGNEEEQEELSNEEDVQDSEESFAALTPEELEEFNKNVAKIMDDYKTKKDFEEQKEDDNLKGTEEGPDFD